MCISRIRIQMKCSQWSIYIARKINVVRNMYELTRKIATSQTSLGSHLQQFYESLITVVSVPQGKYDSFRHLFPQSPSMAFLRGDIRLIGIYKSLMMMLSCPEQKASSNVPHHDSFPHINILSICHIPFIP